MLSHQMPRLAGPAVSDDGSVGSKHDSVQPRVTLLTPSYVGDLDRFGLLRESIERLHIDLPHIVVVHTEDVSEFERIQHRHRLMVVASADVLPPSIERARYQSGEQAVPGWVAQQLIKLSAPSLSSTIGAVCVDSDTFFTVHIDAGDFFGPDGLLQLFEGDRAISVLVTEWQGASMRYLGIDVPGQRARNYVNSPLPMHRDVVLDLTAHLQLRGGRPWQEEFLAHDLTEYNTYGVFARHVDRLTRVTPTSAERTASFWVPQELEDLAGRIGRIDGSRNGIIAVLVNSGLGVPVSSYRHLAQQVWARTCPLTGGEHRE